MYVRSKKKRDWKNPGNIDTPLSQSPTHNDPNKSRLPSRQRRHPHIPTPAPPNAIPRTRPRTDRTAGPSRRTCLELHEIHINNPTMISSIKRLLPTRIDILFREPSPPIPAPAHELPAREFALTGRVGDELAQPAGAVGLLISVVATPGAGVGE